MTRLEEIVLRAELVVLAAMGWLVIIEVLGG